MFDLFFTHNILFVILIIIFFISSKIFLTFSEILCRIFWEYNGIQWRSEKRISDLNYADEIGTCGLDRFVNAFSITGMEIEATKIKLFAVNALQDRSLNGKPTPLEDAVSFRQPRSTHLLNWLARDKDHRKNLLTKLRVLVASLHEMLLFLYKTLMVSSHLVGHMVHAFWGCNVTINILFSS